MTSTAHGNLDLWEERYSSTTCLHGRAPSRFLTESTGFLPPQGRCLDLAMGEGRNALFLASRGYQVTGVDFSSVAVARARAWAAASGLALNAIVSDLEVDPLPKGPFDVVVVINYLQRNLFARLVDILAPGGVLLYETLTVAVLAFHAHRRAYLLEPGELRAAFSGLEVLSYREADPAEPSRCVASLVARRPFEPTL